jgi:hypothetical protein
LETEHQEVTDQEEIQTTVRKEVLERNHQVINLKEILEEEINFLYYFFLFYSYETN